MAYVKENEFTNISPEDLEEALLLCLLTPMDGTPGASDCLWGLTANVIGAPGIGKSAIIKSLCRSINLPMQRIFAAQHPPEDFSGALIPDGNGGAKQISSLGAVRKIMASNIGVIFLDEINGATPATQDALQSFIHERHVGEDDMPGGIRILAASNPEELATSGRRLSPAMANRLVHIHYNGGSVDDWIKWNMGSANKSTRESMDYLTNEVVINWPSKFSSAKGAFSAFLHSNQQLIENRPPKSDRRISEAWPSRRTWDFAQRAFATAGIIGFTNSIRDVVIEGCVGTGALIALNTYLETADLPIPEDVLDGCWEIDTNRLDITMGAYASMTSFVMLSATKSPELITKAWEATERLISTGLADVAVYITQSLSKGKLGREHTSAEVREVAKRVLLKLDSLGAHDPE